MKTHVLIVHCKQTDVQTLRTASKQQGPQNIRSHVEQMILERFVHPEV